MLVIIALLCIATLASAVMTIIMRRKGQSFNGMLFKFLASFGFLSVAFVGFCRNPQCNNVYFCLTEFGLMFGIGGDILLGLKEIAPKFRSRLVLMGTCSFLIGHIFFLAAFTRLSGFSIVTLIVFVVMVAIAFLITKILKLNVDIKLSIVLSVYYGILCTKCAAAFVALYRIGTPAFIVAAIGSVLFIISDTVLGLLYFTPVKSKNKLVSLELGTYYPAQILLALSVTLF